MNFICVIYIFLHHHPRFDMIRPQDLESAVTTPPEPSSRNALHTDLFEYKTSHTIKSNLYVLSSPPLFCTTFFTSSDCFEYSLERPTIAGDGIMGYASVRIREERYGLTICQQAFFSFLHAPHTHNCFPRGCVTPTLLKHAVLFKLQSLVPCRKEQC